MQSNQWMTFVFFLGCPFWFVRIQIWQHLSTHNFVLGSVRWGHVAPQGHQTWSTRPSIFPFQGQIQIGWKGISLFLGKFFWIWMWWALNPLLLTFSQFTRTLKSLYINFPSSYFLKGPTNVYKIIAYKKIQYKNSHRRHSEKTFEEERGCLCLASFLQFVGIHEVWVWCGKNSLSRSARHPSHFAAPSKSQLAQIDVQVPKQRIEL